MRVISQDGAVDVPYDYFSLSIAGAKIVSGMVEDRNVFSIFCHNLSSPNGTKLAEYSAEAKAVKAMEMLRKAYESNEFYHCMTATSDTFKEAVCLLGNKKFEEVTSECFQFPQDDEIEV